MGRICCQLSLIWSASYNGRHKRARARGERDAGERDALCATGHNGSTETKPCLSSSPLEVADIQQRPAVLQQRLQPAYSPTASGVSATASYCPLLFSGYCTPAPLPLFSSEPESQYHLQKEKTRQQFFRQ